MRDEDDAESLILINGFYYVNHTQDLVLDFCRSLCLADRWLQIKHFKTAKMGNQASQNAGKRIVSRTKRVLDKLERIGYILQNDHKEAFYAYGNVVGDLKCQNEGAVLFGLGNVIEENSK